MERVTLLLRDAQTGHTQFTELWKAIKPCLLAGERVTVEARPEKRTDAQNNMLWSILTDISRQVNWHDQKLSPEDWKDMATAALKRQRVLPGLDGGFVVLGARTSKMTKGELSELVEFLYALGAQHDVKWSRTSLGRDIPDLG